MSATVKQRIAFKAPAEELWRVAETGDVDALDPILSRGVDVNARNKHGMTALMRAAAQGHEPMARALLKHGADPNSSRNDKFTPLALAAFFGHTEIVRILIEHGARTDVTTRCGASAQTWAIARTFDEAARCIAARARPSTRASRPAPAPALAPAPAPAPTPTPVPAPAKPAPVASVKILKDPPEIWDLVQEAPRNFNAGSAFMSRLKSMKTNFVLRIAAVVLIGAMCVVGVLVLRDSQARGLPAEPPVTPPVKPTKVSAPVKVTGSATSSVTTSTPETAEFSHHSEAAIANDKPLRKTTLLTRQSKSRPVPSDEPVQIIESREAPAVAPVTVATPQVEKRSSNKPSTSPASPQLISSPKSTPTKAKVIQWP